MRARDDANDPDNACLAQAQGQYGLIHRKQALALGMSSSAIGRRLECGRWKVVLPGVYLIGAVLPTSDTLVVAACLWAGEGSVASHRSAARLWGLDLPVEPSKPEIWTPRHMSNSDVVVHRGCVPRHQRTNVRGIPVTGVHRTLIDLGDVAGENEVEDALDSALRRRMTSIEWLLKEIEDVGLRGRRGPGTLHRLLNEPGAKPPSWLERRFLRLLKKEKLGGYVREHPVGPYQIDFAWLDVKLGIEVHGEKWHRRRRRWSRDLARHNWLTAQGWTMLHFDWDQIDTDAIGVVEEIRQTRARLGLSLAF